MFKYLLLLNALTLSAVAAYYSILGLITIFSAAAIPVAVMGTSLEIGKLVTATFLHNHWKKINWLLKTYLTTAVIVLMVITSLGIFGLLSKANIDANLTVNQAYQRIEQIDRQVTKLEDEQKLSEEAAREASKQNLTQSNDEIDLLRSQLRQSQNSLESLDTAIQLNDVRQIQTIVGVKVDGRYGPNTEKSVRAFRLNEEKKIADLNDRVRTLNDRLQEQKATVTVIDNAEEIRSLTQERFVIEKEVTELEAEVGPIKYISELVYDDSANTTMEEAVRWMIIVIVLVFDPLAISLLLAFNSLNNKGRTDEPNKNSKRRIYEDEYPTSFDVEGKSSNEGDRSRSFIETEEESSTEESSSEEDHYQSESSDSEEELRIWKKEITEQPTKVAPLRELKKRRGKLASARKNLS